MNAPVEILKRTRSALGDLRNGVEAVRRQVLSLQERRRLLSGVESDLFDAELTEESIIRDAEAIGFPLLRRRDADPRAVLATAEVLP